MSLKSFLRSKQFLLHSSLILLVFIVLLLLTTTFLGLYTHHGKVYAVPDFSGLSLREADTEAEYSKMKLEIIDSLYVPEAVPGTVIDQYPNQGYPVKQGRTIFLTIAAVMPELVDVPRVVDISLREAMARLDIAGLVVGRIEYKPSEFINLVLEIRHNGKRLTTADKLPKGSDVVLWVGKGLSDQRIAVPSVVGFSQAEAESRLYSSSLNIGALVYDETIGNSADSLNAVVWKQSPAAQSGREVELGASIDLWLTTDSSKVVETEEDEVIDFEDF
jgi:eukaryotic-like serine/threonine-protein kinase